MTYSLNSWLLCLIKTFNVEFFADRTFMFSQNVFREKNCGMLHLHSENDPNWRYNSVMFFCDGKNGISKSPTPILVYFCVEYSLSLRELTWQLNDIDYPYQMYWSNVEDHLLVGSYIKENNQLTYDIFSVNIVYFPKYTTGS